MSLKTKFIIFFLVVSLIPLFLMTATLVSNVSKIFTNYIIHREELLAHQRTIQVQAYLDRYAARSRVLAGLVAVKGSLNVDQIASEKFLSLYAKEFPEIIQIQLIDKSGLELVKANLNEGKIEFVKGSLLQNKAHSSYVKEGLKLSPGQTYTLNTNLNEEYGRVDLPYKSVISFATPVFLNGSKVIEGLLVLNIKSDAILKKIAESESENIVIIDQDGRLVLNKGQNKNNLSQLLRDLELSLEGPEQGSGAKKTGTKYHYDNRKKRLFIWDKFFLNPNDLSSYFLVISIFTKEELFKSIANLDRIAAVLILLFTGLSMGFAFVVAQGLSRPIKNITEAMVKTSQGDFDIKIVDVESRDEIVLLSRAVNKMSKNLKQMFGDVEKTAIFLQQKNLDLEASNKELARFSYIVSHDLQEPLRKIVGFIEILKTDLQGKFDAKSEGHMDYVIDGARHMSSLIKDLLEFSNAGRVDLQMKKINLNNLVAEVISTMSEITKEKKAQVTCDALPALDSVSPLVSRVFQNLIDNAIKFCPSDRAPCIHISSKEEASQWQFSVKDNGLGIEAVYLDKIFDVFTRLHHRNKYPGTGIGLAICKKLIERHGGKIWAESTLGRGTTVFFTIPKNQVGNSDAA